MNKQANVFARRPMGAAMQFAGACAIALLLACGFALASGASAAYAEDPAEDQAASGAGITSVSVASSTVEVQCTSKCPLCDEAHESDVDVPLSLAGFDPDQAESVSVWVEGYDENVAAATDYVDAESQFIRVTGKTPGETDATVVVVNEDGTRVTAPLHIKVVEAEAPAFSMPASRDYRIDDEAHLMRVYTAGSADFSVEPLVSLGSYPGMTKNAGQGGVHHDQGAYVTFASSSDPDVVAIVDGSYEGVGVLNNGAISGIDMPTLWFKKAGEADITVKDVWGHEGTTHVTVRDVQVNLDQESFRIGVDESLNLVDHIVDPEYDVRYLSFKSDDESVASITDRWNEQTNAREFILTGKSEGTATVTMRYQTHDYGANAWIDRELGSFKVTVGSSEPDDEQLVVSTDKNAVLQGSVSADLGGASDASELAAELSGLTLAVDTYAPAADDLAAQAIERLKSKGNAVVGVYDIYFVGRDDNKYEWNNDRSVLTVRLEPPSKFADSKTLKVYYIDDEGVAEPMSTWVEDGYVAFETTHFSTYAIVDAEKAVDDGGDDGNGGNDEPQKPEDPAHDNGNGGSNVIDNGGANSGGNGNDNASGAGAGDGSGNANDAADKPAKDLPKAASATKLVATGDALSAVVPALLVVAGIAAAALALGVLRMRKQG